MDAPPHAPSPLVAALPRVGGGAAPSTPPAADGFTRIVPAVVLARDAWSQPLERLIEDQLRHGGDIVSIARAHHVRASDVYALQIRQRRRLGRSVETPVALGAFDDPAGSASAARPRDDRADVQTSSDALLLPARPRGDDSVRPRRGRARSKRDVSTPPMPVSSTERRRELRERFAQANRWWQSQVPSESIARRLGMSPADWHDTMLRLRRVLGPGWFPRRSMLGIGDGAAALPTVSGASWRPITSEDFALVFGLFAWDPRAAGAVAPVATGDGQPPLPDQLRHLTSHSRYGALIDELLTLLHPGHPAVVGSGSAELPAASTLHASTLRRRLQRWVGTCPLPSVGVPKITTRRPAESDYGERIASPLEGPTPPPAMRGIGLL